MSCSEDLASAGADSSSSSSSSSTGSTQAAEAADTRPGFGHHKWERMRCCLRGFARRFPASAGAQMQLAALDAAHGWWRAAAQGYAHASKLDALFHFI